MLKIITTSEFFDDYQEDIDYSFEGETANVLYDNVDEWFILRELHTLDSKPQIYKGLSEVGELADGIGKGNKAEQIDAIGDILVVLSGVALQNNIERLLSRDISLVFGMDRQKTIDMHLAELFHELNKLNMRFGFEGIKPSQEYILDSLIKCVKSVYSISYLLNHHPLQCLTSAYLEIKDRKGRVINNIFDKTAEPLSKEDEKQ